jgi:hypothetical protein
MLANGGNKCYLGKDQMLPSRSFCEDVMGVIGEGEGFLDKLEREFKIR